MSTTHPRDQDESTVRATVRATRGRTDSETADPVPTSMRAVVQDSYGGPDVLGVREVALPDIGEDDVLVRVHAAGVGRGVWHLMAGQPYLLRLAGFGLRAPRQRIPGFDVAGRVVGVGRNVGDLRPGQDVFGTCSGSFAEYAVARADQLLPKPRTLSFPAAATVPDSACTALKGLRDVGGVQPGQRVLVIGASGGVGSFAVQIAKALGAEVTGMCSTSKTDLVRDLGADHVLDYTRSSVSDGAPYDLVLDIGGNRSLSELRRSLTPRGTLVIVGGEGGGRWFGGTDRQLRALALSPFLRRSLRSYVSQSDRAHLRVVKDLIEAGAVSPVVDRTFGLDRAAEALEYLIGGKVRGKVAVSVAEDDAR